MRATAPIAVRRQMRDGIALYLVYGRRVARVHVRAGRTIEKDLTGPTSPFKASILEEAARQQAA